MIASVQAIEEFIDTYKAYTRAREYLLYGYEGADRDVYAFLTPKQLDVVSRALGKRPAHRTRNGVEQVFLEHNGCVFYLTKSSGGDAA